MKYKLMKNEFYVISKPKFVINKEKEVVTCILWMKINAFYFFPDRIAAKLNYLNDFTKVVSIAKCDPRDTFNEEEGEKIAYNKAKNKALLKIEEDFLKIARIYTKEFTKAHKLFKKSIGKEEEK